MTHAFRDQVLAKRDRRRLRRARVVNALRNSIWWIAGFVISLLVVVLVVGIAEGRANPNTAFEWPHQWLPRVVSRTGRFLQHTSGFMLVLFGGAWLTIAGIGLLRLVLRIGYGPLAVARSVVDEAVRNKLVLVVIAVLLIALAAQPWASLAETTEDQPLRYKIQTFLSVSTLLAGLLLGAVTILFSAFTVSQDLSERRTGDVFVKPIGRIVYLLGKWLGVVLLMGVLLTVQGTVTWAVAQYWLGNSPVINVDDFTAVQDRVLVARQQIGPRPPEPFELAARERLVETARVQPEIVAERGASDLLMDYIGQERAQFLTLEYGEQRDYVFTGLGEAKARAERLEARLRTDRDRIAALLREYGADIRPEEVSLQLLLDPQIRPIIETRLDYPLNEGIIQFRFKIQGTNTFGSSEERFSVEFNGRRFPRPLSAPINEVQILDLPATLVSDEGILEMTIIKDVPNSAGRETGLSMDPETWMLIFYADGEFGPNVARGFFVIFVRLAFLAMLGVVTASLFSFPVAATFSICFWILAAGGAGLQQMLSYRLAATEIGAVDTGLNDVMLPFVRFLVALLARFSYVNINDALVDGRYITYSVIGSHVLWVGVIWLGLVLAIGGYLFNRREIARVQV